MKRRLQAGVRNDMAVETLEKKLAKLRREVQREWRPLRDALLPPPKRKQSRRDLFAAVCLGILKVATIAALPFFVCARASVFFYQHGAAPWAAVAGGALLMMVVVAVYAAWLSRHFSGRARARTIARWVALPLVAAWCGYAVQYLARTNAKSDDVRGYYSAVHPVLRIALATAILADPDVVVTDLGRVPADYPRMGLPVNERTKHYRQPNGWVHAVDLRTRERGEIRNRTLQFYFWMMGFDTLRHVGTADHLHVQLAPKR